jgi:hypothetical protein
MLAFSWWWPGLKKFHHRFYDEISTTDPGNSLQNTFSISTFEAGVAKYEPTISP